MTEPLRDYERIRDAVTIELAQLETLLPVPHEGLRTAKTRLQQGKFVLAVVGEFSSGKSFLLNALLQKFRYETIGGTQQLVGLLATDINPSTATITELEYATKTEATAIYDNGTCERIPLDALNRFIAVGSGEAGTKHNATKDERGAPSRVVVQTDSPFLQRGFLVADTPGLASINPAHRRATLEFLPNADAVLYLIDTQQPFTEGDAAFLGIIRKQLDSIFIVQTKIDLWQERQSEGNTAWENAYERISSLAAVHAPGTVVCALSAREYAEGILAGDSAHIEASRFPRFLAELDASLIQRTGRARLRRAREQAQLAAFDAIGRIDNDLAMLAFDVSQLHDRRANAMPLLDAVDARVHATAAAIRSGGTARARSIGHQGELLIERLEQQLIQNFDTADIARLRDRARLHMLIDRTLAESFGTFAEHIADESIAELQANLLQADRALNQPEQSADQRIDFPFSLVDEAARAFNGEPGTHAWSGDLGDAISGTIVLDAIGGPSVNLVHDISQRFAKNPAGQYMKRELLGDLRTEIFPRAQSELRTFIQASAMRIERMYLTLATALEACAKNARESRLGSIDRALTARENNATETLTADLTQQRTQIAYTLNRVTEIVDGFAESMSHIWRNSVPGIDDIEQPSARSEHALDRSERTFDRSMYQRGLRKRRWRVAVLGALRRGKSGLINAFADEPILTDDIAGSARFPIHVRYGEHDAAFSLTNVIPSEAAQPRSRGTGTQYDSWHEIAVDRTIAAAAESPVLRLTPWKHPHELVLVHAPALDSGEAHAEDINLVVATQANEILCLFSRQLSDRELNFYQRVAELGKPMLFIHTIADNETARDRRNVVELAAQYLRERNIATSRIFIVSAHEYMQAREERRAPAGWNEFSALISTIEGQAEAHMARLARLGQATTEKTAPESGAKSEPPVGKPGFFARLFKASKT